MEGGLGRHLRRHPRFECEGWGERGGGRGVGGEGERILRLLYMNGLKRGQRN